MALHINKDRSNLDALDKTLAAEDFVKGILDGLDIKSDKNVSSSNDDDIFYEWDFDYKKFMQDIDNKRTTAKYNKWKSYDLQQKNYLDQKHVDALIDMLS